MNSFSAAGHDRHGHCPRFGITVASVHNCKMSEEVWSLANVDRDALHMLGTYIFRILMSSFVAIIVHVAGLLTLATAFCFFPFGYQSSKHCDRAGAESEHNNSYTSCLVSTAQGPEKGSETEAFTDFCLWILLSQVL